MSPQRVREIRLHAFWHVYRMAKEARRAGDAEAEKACLDAMAIIAKSAGREA